MFIFPMFFTEKSQTMVNDLIDSAIEFVCYQFLHNIDAKNDVAQSYDKYL